MQTVIPAAPGTYKINVSGQIASPIIGWLHTTGLRADPIFPAGQIANFAKGDGVIFGASVKGLDVVQCAGIMDIDTGKWFANADDWRKARIKGAEKAEPETGPYVPDTDEAAEPDHSPIKFGRTIGKKKSFWVWPAANALFVMDVNKNLPDDARVEKSTGKEHTELLAQGYTLIDPHTGVEISQDDEDVVAEKAAPEAPAEDADEYADMI